MSKLAQQINSTITNKRASIIEPYSIKMGMNINSMPYDPYANEVKFSCTFGVSYYIKEHEQDKIQYILSNVKKQVIEEVFGEFRPTLHKLRHELYSREYDKALNTLDTLQKDMFDVG